MSQYDVEVELEHPNTSHAQVARLVGRDRRVLDVGCWKGDLGRVLRQRGCTVTGVDVAEAAVAVAATVLDRALVVDLEQQPLPDLFTTGEFDVVVMGDVLEHLTDPVGVLRDALSLLDADGSVVVSIPNVTHGSVRLALLEGRWDYTETGLLDRTHLQFWSRRGLLELVADAGGHVEQLVGTLADPLATEVRVDGTDLPPTVVEWVRDQEDALVYQFVASIRPGGAARVPALETVEEGRAVRSVDRHTRGAAADRDLRHRLLTQRDHIIGLEATTAAAVARQASVEARLQERLATKNERIAVLRRRVTRLQRRQDAPPPAAPPSSLTRLAARARRRVGRG